MPAFELLYLNCMPRSHCGTH